MKDRELVSLLEKEDGFHDVVPYNSVTGKIAAIDLSKNNTAFTPGIYNSTETFIRFINEQRSALRANYLIGGYREHREMYSRSELFNRNLSGHDNKDPEPRSIHLGTDIWGDAGTKVYSPLGGMVHSFANNNQFGDYGVTIILQHQLKTINFYTLYGHLSLVDIEKLRKGQFISRGECFAHFGSPEENGNWPAHLHFQLIIDLGIHEGDYPGVCKPGEAATYLRNCPDPDLLLKLNKYIV